MEVIAKIETKLNLKPFLLPFEYSFAWNKKSNGQTFWFTPSGKAKIWFGGLNTKTIGKISIDDEKSLIESMKEGKADALYNDNGHWTDTQKLYTITSDGIVEVINLNEKLVTLNEEFEARKDYEDWVNICEAKFGN